MWQLIEFWKKSSERKKDAFCLLALVIFCLLLFSKTVFCGQSISRAYELANLDFLFRTDGWMSSKYDVDCFFMKLPGYLMAARQWREGILPLWNPYCGGGAPLLAELQSIVLSPWLLFYVVSPTMQMHSYLLVAQQVLAAVGMFLVARSLGLPRYAAILAALVHLCCPHQQWRSELQMNHSFYPITLFSFVRLYQTRHFLWALAAGAGCAAQIVSGDAQVSLLSITVASVFFVFLNILGEARRETLLIRLKDAGVWLAAAGFNALCLSAPVFLSFVEYVRLGDLSKQSRYYAVGEPAPWQSLLYSLLHPGFGGSSLYAGCLSLILVCLSLFALKTKRRYYLTVLLTAFFAFMNASRTGFFPFFDQAAGLMGLSRFEGMEVYLVQIALLMGFGLQELVDNPFTVKSASFFTLLSACILTGAVPRYLESIGFDKVDLEKITFDPHAESYGFRQEQWIFDVCALSVFLIFVLCRAKLKNLAPAALILLALSINSASEICALKNALPHPPNFKYPNCELLDILALKKERIVPVGDNLLHPNSNIVYKIPSLAYKGPLAPYRLARFSVAAGGQKNPFRKVFPRGPFNKLIDIAGVRYLVSFNPVRSVDEPYTHEKICAQEVTFKGDSKIKMTAAKVFYDARKGEVGGHVDWFVKEGEGESYCFEIDIFDKTGKILWTGGPYYVRQREFFKKDIRPKESSRMPLDALVPMPVTESSDFSVGVRVFRLPKMQVLQPETMGVRAANDVLALATFTKKTLALQPERRFKLLREFPSGFIRLYENLQSMPVAKLVHKTVLAGSEKEALLAIAKPSFDPHTVAVVEDKSLVLPEGDVSSQTDRVLASRPDENSLAIDVKAASSGLLVVTDQFFPGWHALVDGKEVPLGRANYLFKCLPVEAGSHKISLYFWPTCLSVSLLLFCGCLLLNALAWFYPGRKRQSSGT